MPETMENNFTDILKDLCRLCANTHPYCVDVFSSDGNKHFIEKKIRLCLPVIIEKDDEMPRQICLNCLNKLDTTYELHTTCITAQTTIMRLIKNESSPECDRVNKARSEVQAKDKVPQCLTLNQYLKRKIDLKDTEMSSKVRRTNEPEKDTRSSNTDMVSTRNLETLVSVPGENSSSSVMTESQWAMSAESQKPKLRVKTATELAQAGQMDIVRNCTSAPFSLQNSSTVSISVPATTQSTNVIASHSSNVVFSLAGVTQDGHSSSCLPQHVMSSSAPQNGTSLSSVPQHVKSGPSVIQFGASTSFASEYGKNLSALKCSTSASFVPQNNTSVSSVLQLSKSSSCEHQFSTNSPVAQKATISLSVPQKATTSLSVPQKATTSLSVPQKATASLSVPLHVKNPLPVPQNTKTSLSVPKNGNTFLPMPQHAMNSPSVQNYSLTIPVSSSGHTILRHGTNFIIMPQKTFVQTQTFNVAGTRTIAVLPSGASMSAVPSNMTLAGDVSISFAQAVSLAAPQNLQPMQSPQSLSAAGAVLPPVSSSLPLVQAVSFQLPQQSENQVIASQTSAPTNIIQSSITANVRHNVLNRNNQAHAVSSNSGVTDTLSGAKALSRGSDKPSTQSQDSNMSSDTTVSTASNVSARRVIIKDGNSVSQCNTLSQGVSDHVSNVVMKQISAQLGRNSNTVTGSKEVSHAATLPQPLSLAVVRAKNDTNNPQLLAAQQTITPKTGRKTSMIQPGKTSCDIDNSSGRKLLLDGLNHGSGSGNCDSNTHSDTASVSTYSGQSASKVNHVPPNKTRATVSSPVCCTETTAPKSVSSSQSVSFGTVGITQRGRRRGRSITARKVIGNTTVESHNRKNCNDSAGNTQVLAAETVSNARAEPQLSETQPQEKASVARSRLSGGIPPLPSAVPLNSVGVSEDSRLLVNTGDAGVQNFTATSAGNQAVSGQTLKPCNAAVTSTVNTTVQPASKSQSSVNLSAEAQVEPASSSAEASVSAVKKEECPHCHIAFPTDILMHHKTLHYREKFYTCIDCDKNFVTEKGLESHRCQKESKG